MDRLSANIKEDINVNLDSIQFCDIFVLEEVQKLQQAFSDATGVASVITNTDGEPITKPSNFCRLCQDLIRNTEKGRKNCIRSDAYLGRFNPLGPTVRTCLSGDLWDAGASISVGGRHIANWLIGQVRNDKPDISRMIRYAEEIGVDSEEYIKALEEIPVMSFDKFSKVAEMLFQFANELSEKAYTNLLLKNQISEREKASQLLRMSEEKYRLLVENSYDIIYTLNLNGIFTFVSPSWTTILGHSPNQVLGKSFQEFVHIEEIPYCLQFLNELIVTGQPQNGVEYRIRDKDGIWHWHTSGCVPILDELDCVIGFYGISRDVTERKLAEAEIKLKNENLCKANAEKDKFFSIIAHDLRSPFNNFLGFTKLMAEDQSDLSKDEIQYMAASIHDSAANLFRLLENLLQWAKVQQGLIPVHLKILSLELVIKECVSVFLESAKNKNIHVCFDIPKDYKVFSDSNVLKTIVRNLVSNAVKFTPKGGSVKLSAKIRDPFIEISVSDSGIGMTNVMVENLFKLDVPTSRCGTENEPSTGLGLILCKEFVESQGGNIWVESVTGQGSTFYFTVPGSF